MLASRCFSHLPSARVPGHRLLRSQGPSRRRINCDQQEASNYDQPYLVTFFTAIVHSGPIYCQDLMVWRIKYRQMICYSHHCTWKFGLTYYSTCTAANSSIWKRRWKKRTECIGKPEIERWAITSCIGIDCIGIEHAINIKTMTLLHGFAVLVAILWSELSWKQR